MLQRKTKQEHHLRLYKSNEVAEFAKQTKLAKEKNRSLKRQSAIELFFGNI